MPGCLPGWHRVLRPVLVLCVSVISPSFCSFPGQSSSQKAKSQCLLRCTSRAIRYIYISIFVYHLPLSCGPLLKKCLRSEDHNCDGQQEHKGVQFPFREREECGVRLMIYALINSNPPLPPTPILSHITPAPYPYLPTFGKLKSGHLRYDVILTMIAKRSLRGRSPRFSRGVRGMLPRENFENRGCQIRIFQCFGQ